MGICQCDDSFGWLVQLDHVPSIFTIGIAGLGALTSEASSLIVMAIVGGAIIPLAQEDLQTVSVFSNALLIPLVCYVYIAFYGLWANKRVTTESSTDDKSPLPFRSKKQNTMAAMVPQRSR